MGEGWLAMRAGRGAMGSEDLGDGREWETNETGGSRCEPGERLEAIGERIRKRMDEFRTHKL